LTRRARIGDPPGLPEKLNGTPTPGTGVTTLAIDLNPTLSLAHLSRPGLGQFQGPSKDLVLFFLREARDLPTGVNVGPKENFNPKNIPNSGDNLLVEKNLPDFA
jgi:hypothetical protein